MLIISGAVEMSSENYTTHDYSHHKRSRPNMNIANSSFSNSEMSRVNDLEKNIQQLQAELQKTR
jgi:hypothetical protein